jgi:hypothetical protein
LRYRKPACSTWRELGESVLARRTDNLQATRARFPRHAYELLSRFRADCGGRTRRHRVDFESDVFGGVLTSLLFALGAADVAGLALEQRVKTPLLARDLASLGMAPRPPGAQTPAPDLPRLRTPARAPGGLHVLEGATLGGKVIEREVHRRLGLDRASGTSFFGAYGSQVLPRWRELCAVIEREARTLGVDPIAESARATFDAIEEWLLR